MIVSGIQLHMPSVKILSAHFTKGFKNLREKVILLGILWILQPIELERLQRGIGSMNNNFSL